ncbi:expressed unknown protein [Seminavis robusta]|uniref:Uncharacterized protein n=1 Tax=Seminavis robusta TaxID=568900 RepID=A0A9N8DIV3_9STRA|nr:expressed unknown protein [Seminavis robusta]|eukprot:Sro106_g053660.1 n/a (162) ;mRNA; f:105948-106433
MKRTHCRTVHTCVGSKSPNKVSLVAKSELVLAMIELAVRSAAAEKVCIPHKQYCYGVMLLQLSLWATFHGELVIELTSGDSADRQTTRTPRASKSSMQQHGVHQTKTSQPRPTTQGNPTGSRLHRKVSFIAKSELVGNALSFDGQRHGRPASLQRSVATMS